MKKRIILAVIFMISCATTVYNRPFINADETKQLEFFMSIDEVISTIGRPLFVESGGNGQIIWIYEVRTIMVESDVNTSGIIPRKTHQNTKHGPAIHKLELMFNSGELISWNEYIIPEKVRVVEIENNNEMIINGVITVKELE